MQAMAGYVRVSRVGGRKGPSFVSPEQQRERIEWWASGHDVEVIWYEELDRSGGDDTRPEWQAAIGACERGELVGIIVAKLDRFARSARDAFKGFDRLAGVGARFVSVEDGFDDSTAMGRFARGMIALIAELERERITESWESAASGAVADGVHVAPTPYGYLREKNDDGKTPASRSRSIR